MSNKEFFVFSIFACVTITAIIGVKAWAKLEICDTYYKDINRAVCFVSEYSLPQIKSVEKSTTCKSKHINNWGFYE